MGDPSAKMQLWINTFQNSIEAMDACKEALELLDVDIMDVGGGPTLKEQILETKLRMYKIKQMTEELKERFESRRQMESMRRYSAKRNCN